jgi:hypothetical protein
LGKPTIPHFKAIFYDKRLYSSLQRYEKDWIYDTCTSLFAKELGMEAYSEHIHRVGIGMLPYQQKSVSQRDIPCSAYRFPVIG